jgi:uncharacterized protein (DUF58 family)
MIVKLHKSRISLSRSGIYLVFFAFGLAVASLAVAANILFLLDLFLFSALIFSYFYLRFLKKKSLQIDIPSLIEEDRSEVISVSGEKMPPFTGRLQLEGRRFSESFTVRGELLFFSDQSFVNGLAFNLRGFYRLQKLTLVITFPFGLFHLTCVEVLDSTITVIPLCAKSPLEMPAAFFARLKNIDEEFSRLKPYVAGDPKKMISWKHYAKTRTLLVKEFERVTGEELFFALFYPPEEEKSFFSRASTLFHQMIDEGQSFQILSGDGVFFCDGRRHNKLELSIFLAKYFSPDRAQLDAHVLTIY